MTSIEIKDLEKKCTEIRKDILVMADAAGESGLHFGGSLSMVEIAAVLYLKVMDINKENITSEKRDRLVLSKGHGVPAIYAVLKQKGILNEKDLQTFKSDNTFLYGHPCLNRNIGIEFSTGSLGQGLSLGVGTALALKYKNNNKPRVFVILGDGECNEGSVWEAAMSASKYNLDNLIVIIDRNNIQYDGYTKDVMPLNNLNLKWESFGWDVYEIDGHNIGQCYNLFSKSNSRPMAVIANTVKGKGISFMENIPEWHHSKMTEVQHKQAWEEINNGCCI